MIDRVVLHPEEAYEFQTDGSQYVVVVSLANDLEVLKGDKLLAKLDWLEMYSCPANTGSYIVRNPQTVSVVVLLVRYILL
jgi:hypothetical protein